MKFARNVHFQIKNGKEQEFTTLFEKEALPMLRKQKGFLEALTLVNKDGAIGISIWDDRNWKFEFVFSAPKLQHAPAIPGRLDFSFTVRVRCGDP